jgi:hypothetical protein
VCIVAGGGDDTTINLVCNTLLLGYIDRLLEHPLPVVRQIGRWWRGGVVIVNSIDIIDPGRGLPIGFRCGAAGGARVTGRGLPIGFRCEAAGVWSHGCVLAVEPGERSADALAVLQFVVSQPLL